MDQSGPRVSNPLVERLCRERTWLPLRRAVVFALALGGAGTLIGAYSLLDSPDYGGAQGAGLSFIGGWALALFVPLLTATTAVRATSQAIRSEDFELIFITPLSNRALVRAHVFAVLYRLRLILVILAATLPLLIIGSLSTLLSIRSAFSTVGVPGPYTAPVRPAIPDQTIALSTLLAVAALIMLWHMNLLAASRGVRVVLMGGGTGLWATPSAVLFVLGFTTGLCTLPVLMLDAVGPFATYEAFHVALVVVIAVGLMALPVVLAILDMRWTASHWAR